MQYSSSFRKVKESQSFCSLVADLSWSGPLSLSFQLSFHNVGHFTNPFPALLVFSPHGPLICSCTPHQSFQTLHHPHTIPHILRSFPKFSGLQPISSVQFPPSCSSSLFRLGNKVGTLETGDPVVIHALCPRVMGTYPPQTQGQSLLPILFIVHGSSLQCP